MGFRNFFSRSALTVLIASSLLNPVSVDAASDTANATATVQASISIAQQAGEDLEFGTAVQGDGSATVNPTDGGNAQFDVSGEPNLAYTITLPGDGTVTMITDDGATADEQIAVNSFVSSPAAGANGLLDGSGAQVLQVGATRAAILANQVTGLYSASFTVDVVY